MKLLCSLLLVFACSLPAGAQQLYKCGNTFSQTPCAKDAKATPLRQDAAPQRAPGSSGFELCASQAIGASGTPEPASAIVQPLGERVSQVIQYAGQPLSAHRYDLSVDAKNLQGFFSGPVAYSCWLSEDQARVLQFSRRRIN